MSNQRPHDGAKLSNLSHRYSELPSYHQPNSDLTEPGSQEVKKLQRRKLLWNICLVSLFLILISGNIGLFYLYKITEARIQNTVPQKPAPLDQFQQDVQGWQKKVESLTSYDSINNIRWKNTYIEPLSSGHCLIVQDTYRAGTKPGIEGNTCTGTLNPDQQDIALQVLALPFQGDEFGIVLRWSQSGKHPSFAQLLLKKIGPDGRWTLRKGTPDASGKNVHSGYVPGLFKDSIIPTKIGMKAFGGDIYVYINGLRVGHYYDKNPADPGKIGLSSGSGTPGTGSDIMFSRAEIYIPNP